MVEILDELYARWGDFTEEQQLGLAEAIAGEFTNFIICLPF